MPSMDLPIPEGLPPWLAAFVLEAQRETDTLRENGAEQAAAARDALLKKLARIHREELTRMTEDLRPPGFDS